MDTQSLGALGAQIAQTRQNVALSSIKQNAEAGKQLANVIQETASSVPVAEGRGSNLDILV